MRKMKWVLLVIATTVVFTAWPVMAGCVTCDESSGAGVCVARTAGNASSYPLWYGWCMPGPTTCDLGGYPDCPEDPCGDGGYPEPCSCWIYAMQHQSECSGGGGQGGSGDDACDLSCSPLVVKLTNGPWLLGDVADPVMFDLNGDGTREAFTWTKAGTDVAFLALDVNRNGIIDDGRELFGDATARNGFEALRSLDVNRDGAITAADPAWLELLLWTDWDHDGRSRPHELAAVATSGITSLGLNYHETRREDRGGNAFRFQSLVWFGSQVRPYYDVFFRIVE